MADSFLVIVALNYLYAILTLAFGTSMTSKRIATIFLLVHTARALIVLHNEGFPHFDHLFLGMQAQGLLLLVNHIHHLAEQNASARPHFRLIDRLDWAVATVFNPRGISCPWGVRTPPHRILKLPWLSTRTSFVISRLTQVAFFLVLIEIDVELRSYLTPLAVRQATCLTSSARLLLTYETFIPLYLTWSAYHSLASAIAVALFGGKPEYWPPLFGSPLAAYTLRGFWGCV